MPRRQPSAILFMALAGCSLICGTPAAAEMPGPDRHEEVLEFLKRDLDKAAPGAKWDRADEFVWGYKVFGKEPKGRTVIARVNVLNQIADVETAIPIDDLPRVVTDALKAHAGRFKPHATSSVGRVLSEPVYYRFEGDRATPDIRITADGLVLPRDFPDWNLIGLEDIHPAAVRAASETVAECRFSLALCDNFGNDWLFGRNAKGKRVQFIHVTSDGNQRRIFRTEIPLSETPPAVMKALYQNVPGITPRSVELTGENSPQATEFRFDVERPGGRRFVVLVSLDGQHILGGG